MLVSLDLPEGLVSQLPAQGITEELFAERFHAAVSGYFPVFLVALVAGAAVLFSGLFRKHPFLTHAVFALHWTAFFFIVEAIVQVLPLPDWVSNSTPIVLLLYLAIAMRSVLRSELDSERAQGVPGIVRVRVDADGVARLPSWPPYWPSPR